MTLKTGKIQRPTIDDFIYHIDYVAQLLGSTDYMGVGTDMSLGTCLDYEYDPWGEPAYKNKEARFAICWEKVRTIQFFVE